VGTCLAVAYEAAPEAVQAFLPLGLKFHSPRCAAYFVEWQYASESGEEFLDPVRSQYRETIILISAVYDGAAVAYCPFIWVDQDASPLRGWAQGWPKQVGSTLITRAYDLPSPATPAVGPGGRFGATLAVKDRRLLEAAVTLREQTNELPTPSFAGAVNTRHFPELVAGRHGRPAVYELGQLKSRDVQVSPIWKGEADLTIVDHPYLELPDLRPTKMLAGYRFSSALTMDDLLLLRDLRAG